MCKARQRPKPLLRSDVPPQRLPIQRIICEPQRYHRSASTLRRRVCSVYYNKETATWRFEDDDGNEMEFDATKGSWVPVVSAAAS